MEEREVFIQAIENFSEKQDPLSEELDQFITYIARTGDILAPWEKVQKVFMNKLQLVLDEFYTMVPYKEGKVNSNSINDDFDEMKKRLLQLTEEFDSPPFTIQRLCELLSEPRKNYTKCDKFMRGIEKNLMVVSSWSNLPRRLIENNEAMVNGVDAGTSNGYVPVLDNRLKPHWANLPPSPISTTPPKIPGAPDFTAVTFPKFEPSQDNSKVAKEEATTSEPVVSEPVETPQEVKDETTSEEAVIVDSKSNTTSAIISSPKTINIKRKIDESCGESPETDERDPSTTEIAESPTKKLKSDSAEVVEQGHKEDGEEKSESTKPENDKLATPMQDASGKTDEIKSAEHPHDVSHSLENTDIESKDSANEDTNTSETPSAESGKSQGECNDEHLGSSVDPAIEKMEVD